jgi:quinol monooxygenase YgiN
VVHLQKNAGRKFRDLCRCHADREAGNSRRVHCGAIACIKETRKEPGNIAYDLHESVTDPSKMVFVEQWENAEALVPHRAAEHMKTFGRVAVKCVSAPPKIEVITPEKVDVR